MKAIKFFSLMLCFVASMGFVSCSDDDDDDVSAIMDNLVGTWYGSKVVSATGSERELTVIFRSNGTGQLIYESNVYYRVAEFTYSISGSRINCDGVIVGDDGGYELDWSQSFEYHEDYLTPIGDYSDIYLEKN